jgi:protoheme IX farnesyltransferase
MTGALYTAAAIAAGLGVLYFGGRLKRERTLPRARAVLLATVFYLPALFCVMVLDRR